MQFAQACTQAHVRSAIRRQSRPEVLYWKNHTQPLAIRVPAADQAAEDWEEYDPREHAECAAYEETPA
jgi:hypothetical protein